MTALVSLLGAALVMAGSAYLAVRYGYRNDKNQIRTLRRHLDEGRPGWKIWI